MIVVASSGLNIPRALIEQYQIEETQQQIVIDGAMHEVRTVPSFSVLDEWIRTARVSPYLLGTSTSDFTTLFDGLAKRTSEILVVTGTRKSLGTYSAAIEAADAVMRQHAGIVVRVVDTGLVEFGAGVLAAYAAACAHAEYGLEQTATALAAASNASIQMFAPYALQTISTSSATGNKRSVISSIVGSPPILHMKDGEIRTAGFFATRGKAAATLYELLQKDLRPNQSIWAAITYAGEKTQAEELMGLMTGYFDVRYGTLRHLGPAGYLVLGAKALGVSVHPTEAMGLRVTLPVLS